ncbi:mitochondrial proton/calcium exchanger protein-like protein isoform X1 [Tanacetum coccineum]
MLRAFPMYLTGAASRWLRNKPTGSITTWEDQKTRFLCKYRPSARTAKKMEEINNFQQEPDENLYQAWERFKELLMKGVIPSKTTADANTAIQEMAEYSQKWHNGTSRVRSTKISDGLAAIQAQLNNLRREIKKVNEKVYVAQVGYAAIRNQEASIKSLEIQIGQMSKVLQERGFGSLPSSTEANLRDQVRSISTIIKAYSYPIRRIRSSQYVVSTGHSHTLMYETRQTTIPFPSHLNVYYCEEKKGSYGPQFSEAYSEASQSIPQKEKDPGSFTLPCFINNVCFDNALVDFGASVSVMPLSTYLNLGLGKLAHTKLTVELADRTVKYPKGIAENVLVGIARLMGETLVLNRSLDPFLKDYIELNDLNEPFELWRNQGDDLMPTIEEGEVIKEFRTRDDELNVGVDDYPSYCDYDKKIHIDFLENMDDYRDEGMGDVIFGETFLREVGIKTRRFEGMITIYNGDDEVTYQMDLGSKEYRRILVENLQIWKILKCWSLETSRRLFNTILLKKLNMDNLPSEYQGSFSF